MKDMLDIALRTEYSFKQTFGPIESLAEDRDVIGIADINNTYGHVKLHNICMSKNGKKPLFGVRLMVVVDPAHRIKGQQGLFGPEYIFIAKNDDGLREIYRLTSQAFDNFYWRPMVSYLDVFKLSKNVIVIAEDFDYESRIDYVALTQTTPLKSLEADIPRVAISNNSYSNPDDMEVYQLLAGASKRGDGFVYNMENATYPQHILTAEEHYAIWKDQSALDNTFEIADKCNATMKIAAPVEYKGEGTLMESCQRGAFLRGINIDSGVYADRLRREIRLINEKNFADYFMIVAEMVRKAKDKMLVGPGRGSSGGSLVCYLTGITEVDPIKYGLLFERFIDINRFDMPDIDVDFPDSLRNEVLLELENTYGREHVCHIGTIMKMKPKLAIKNFAMGLGIPIDDTEAVKDAIIERSGGDARAAMRIIDTFESTEVGKDFIERYPAMRLVEKIEGHSYTQGTHAAGILVANDPITEFASIDSRTNSAMLDGREAESINLLKIDCLGLRTLSVLQDCAKAAGFDFNKFYELDFDDPKVYEIFRDRRLNGIFQFEGYALQSVNKEIEVNKFDDIIAITALARPGPLHSGGTKLFTERRSGKSDIEFMYDHPSIKEATGDTYGVIIFQEQLMRIAKDFGDMTWNEVSQLRKAASKSLGEEFFNKFKERFLEGTRKIGVSDTEAVKVWENMVTFGSWGFNKSHAVAYAVISYWTAWAKTYHPLEFTVANLNNSKNPESAIRILRDAVRYDKVEYVPVDPDKSKISWSVQNNILVGGLTNIHGIGASKASQIIKRRNQGLAMTPSMIRMLSKPKTDFDILNPCDYHFGAYYDYPDMFGIGVSPSLIEDVNDPGVYLFIGRLVDRNLRDMNEYGSVVKRGGKIEESHTLFLNMTVEDDTDSIICKIGRYDFEEKGRVIAETANVGQDWYLIKGRIGSGGWRIVFIEEIMQLEIEE